MENSLVGIESIFGIRKRIERQLVKFENDIIANSFKSLLNLLIMPYCPNYREIEKIGVYKVLFFGINSRETIKKLLGISASGIVNKEMSYLLNIERDYRDKVIIDFKKNLTFSEENKIQIIKIFNKFDNSVDVKRFLKTDNANLPSLTISNFESNNIHSFLNNPGTELTHLLGLGSVKRVNIHIQQDSSDDFYSIINNLEIITPKAYQHFTEKLKTMEDIQSCVKNKITEYNLVVLDTQDDLLIIEYLELYKKYIIKYNFNIPNLKASIANNIFYTANDIYLKETRLFEEEPKYKDLILPNNLDYLITNWNSNINLIFKLNYILGYILNKTKVLDSGSKQKILYLQDKIISNKKIIISDVRELPSLFNALNEILLKFQQSKYLKIHRNNREEIFSHFFSIIDKIIQFDERYSKLLSVELEASKDELLSLKNEYCSKKRNFIFWKIYALNSTDFESYINDSLIIKLKSFIKKISSSLDIQSCSSILSEIDFLFSEQIYNYNKENINYSIANIASILSNEISNLYS